MSGIYQNYVRSTSGWGDYAALQYGLRDCPRSRFLSDVAAVSEHLVVRLGLRKGDVFTVFLPPCIEAMVIFMAANANGVIVNFVHPAIPPETLSEILGETGASGIAMLSSGFDRHAEIVRQRGMPILVCSSGFYARDRGSRPAAADWPSHGVTYGAVLEDCRQSDALQCADCAADDVAIYLQGGGTTGKSRTIMLTNANVLHLVESYREINGTAARPGIDTEVSCMPIYHAYGLFMGGLAPMFLGYKVAFLPVFTSGEFIECMRRSRVVQFRGVPNMFKKLVCDPEWDGAHLASVERVSCGGEYVSSELMEEADRLFAKNGAPARIVRGYGLTECCGTVSINPADTPHKDSIGRPLQALRVEIWNGEHCPVADGEIGEIAVSGPTVMKGYLTADRKPGVGIYQDGRGRKWMLTGDLGYLKDGYLYFVGRRKRLIIISGYNVHPLDIEKVVREIPQVRESCAVQGYDGNGKKIVRLFVQLADESANREATTEAILEMCRDRLLPVSIPRDVRYIDELPRTRVGKVDFLKLTQQRADDGIFAGMG